jgi:putative phosphoribosyl transferase
MNQSFQDRVHAGRILGQALRGYANHPDVMVLGLPRGGVIVASEVAKILQAPLDVYVVRKLGLPGHEELAIGAIASGGVRVLNQELVDYLGVDTRVVDGVAERESVELARREAAYRADRSPLDVHGRTVVLIDDGIATGSTMLAAIAALRRGEPSRIVAAAPVGSGEACFAMQRAADEVICAMTPEPFFGVGRWYDDFSQVDDDEVRRVLREHASLSRPLSSSNSTL